MIGGGRLGWKLAPAGGRGTEYDMSQEVTASTERSYLYVCRLLVAFILSVFHAYIRSSDVARGNQTSNGSSVTAMFFKSSRAMQDLNRRPCVEFDLDHRKCVGRWGEMVKLFVERR